MTPITDLVGPIPCAADDADVDIVIGAPPGAHRPGVIPLTNAPRVGAHPHQLPSS